MTIDPVELTCDYLAGDDLARHNTVRVLRNRVAIDPLSPDALTLWAIATQLVTIDVDLDTMHDEIAAHLEHEA